DHDGGHDLAELEADVVRDRQRADDLSAGVAAGGAGGVADTGREKAERGDERGGDCKLLHGFSLFWLLVPRTSRVDARVGIDDWLSLSPGAARGKRRMTPHLVGDWRPCGQCLPYTTSPSPRRFDLDVDLHQHRPELSGRHARAGLGFDLDGH